MKFTFLGTGTSQGIPVIGCKCSVCMSTDSRDCRLRTAAHVEVSGHSIAIDCGPDFRQQMLTAGITRLDAILLTHEHNDHIIGLDDMRPYNFIQGKGMEIYGLKRVLNALQNRFAYIFAPSPYPGSPKAELNEVTFGEIFGVGDIVIEPIKVDHGTLPILGFRIGNLAYVTDAKYLDKQEIDKIKDTDYLVLNALRHQSHHSHLSLDEAIELAETISAKTTYLIHLSHHLGSHKDIEATLPDNVHLAYDGLCIHC